MSSPKKERTRFAPSPTGFPHIGSIWIALLQWLHAKSMKGDFIVRIEDTDRTRFVSDAEATILEALRWYGLDYDEGPDKGGPFGPYRQSERLELYKKYVDVLLEKKAVYPCFCSAKRLEEVRQEQQKNKLPTGYDRQCRNIDEATASNRMLSESYVLRLKMLESGETKFTDVIRGEITFLNELVDDQVLVKSDGWPTYHLAVVVDDHLMEITTVIRGEEWISSTPKHIAIYEAFGWDIPRFAHMPLIVGKDRAKLGKRHGSVAALSFRDAGYLPETMINFLALLGWHPKGNEEILTRQAIIDEFQLVNVNKSGAYFDEEKLAWMNSAYIKKLSGDDLYVRALPFLLSSGFIKKLGDDFSTKKGKQITQKEITSALLASRDRVSRLDEFSAVTEVYLDPITDFPASLLTPKKSTLAVALDRLRLIREWVDSLEKNDFTEENFEQKLRNLITEKNLGVGDTLWPLRVALSGEAVSPSPFHIAAVIGKDEVLSRIDFALQKLTT